MYTVKGPEALQRAAKGGREAGPEKGKGGVV
jgi:hypothetical protein